MLDAWLITETDTVVWKSSSFENGDNGVLSGVSARNGSAVMFTVTSGDYSFILSSMN